MWERNDRQTKKDDVLGDDDSICGEIKAAIAFVVGGISAENTCSGVEQGGSLWEAMAERLG